MTGLDSEDLAAARYCAAEVIRLRRQYGQPIPEWLRRHAHTLTSAMADNGPAARNAVTQSDSWISTAAAARLLGVTARHVRRIAANLDGQQIGNRWIFNRTAVHTYAEGRKPVDQQQH